MLEIPDVLIITRVELLQHISSDGIRAELTSNKDLTITCACVRMCVRACPSVGVCMCVCVCARARSCVRSCVRDSFKVYMSASMIAHACLPLRPTTNTFYREDLPIYYSIYLRNLNGRNDNSVPKYLAGLSLFAVC